VQHVGERHHQVAGPLAMTSSKVWATLLAMSPESGDAEDCFLYFIKKGTRFHQIKIIFSNLNLNIK
jgi:hypothetical protein